jgi:hypothetical protein
MPCLIRVYDISLMFIYFLLFSLRIDALLDKGLRLSRSGKSVISITLQIDALLDKGIKNRVTCRFSVPVNLMRILRGLSSFLGERGTGTGNRFPLLDKGIKTVLRAGSPCPKVLKNLN